jgi:hypothetical protein
MEPATIPQHKTAIRRGDFSRPVKCLLRDGLLSKNLTFFDYGCGHGEDLTLLAKEGIACSGWDPAYRPDAPRQQADVVNLGYVLNVIEDPEERAATLHSAWALCRQEEMVPSWRCKWAIVVYCMHQPRWPEMPSKLLVSGSGLQQQGCHPRGTATPAAGTAASCNAQAIRGIGARVNGRPTAACLGDLSTAW